MYRSYKTEIRLTKSQRRLVDKTIGVCRFVYNLYIGLNQRLYMTAKGEDLSSLPALPIYKLIDCKALHQEYGSFMSANTFSKWLNAFVKSHPDFDWIKQDENGNRISSKAVKQSVKNAEAAFKKFFNKTGSFPRFKKKNRSDVKMYFVKNNPTDCICQRHRIKIPALGFVCLKEKGYLPVTKPGQVITSGAVSVKAGRYYASVRIKVDDPEKTDSCAGQPGLGVDLGLKEFAVTSDGKAYPNINKSSRMKKLEKRLKREQRSLSRKYEALKKRKEKGEAAQTQANIQKQKLKVQRLYKKMEDIRTDYINKTIAKMVKTKPSYITIEDLNVRGMMKNRHLAKAVAQQKFYEFRVKLQNQCVLHGIELRVVDRFYPSSKTCHDCGAIKQDLKLSERTYACPHCGHTADRDLNAALNLRDASTFTLA